MPEVYKGLAYPMVEDPRGFFYPQSGANSIRANLLSILLTNRYERVMETDFGASLNSALFELNGDAVVQDVRSRIIAAIEEYEPRITVEELLVTFTPPDSTLVDRTDLLSTGQDGQVLYVRISYVEPTSPLQIQDLNLELPVTTGQINGNV